MAQITYSLVYTPNKSVVDKNINYVCSDNKIHIRFRDFTSEQRISGFERKLTYLMTYLANFSSLSNQGTKKKLFEEFVNSEDYKELYRFLRYDIHIKFRDFLLTGNYKKNKSQVSLFGEVDPKAFPLTYDVLNNSQKGSLELFQSLLRIDLATFLFDDGYEIVIYKTSGVNANQKFINKETRKQKDYSDDYVQLW